MPLCSTGVEFVGHVAAQVLRARMGIRMPPQCAACLHVLMPHRAPYYRVQPEWPRHDPALGACVRTCMYVRDACVQVSDALALLDSERDLDHVLIEDWLF